MRIVVLSPRGAYADDALAPADPDEITMVCWADSGAPDVGRLVSLAAPGRVIGSVARWMSTSMPLRVLMRLTPLDPGVVYWRAVRRSPDAVGAVRRADLIVAPERDGAYAAWRWMRIARRHGAPAAVVSGYPAARATIDRNHR